MTPTRKPKGRFLIKSLTCRKSDIRSRSGRGK